MSPQETRSRHYKRALAIAGATIVAAGGTIGLAFAASSDDTEAASAKPVTTAPASPSPPAGTQYPTPTAPATRARCRVHRPQQRGQRSAALLTPPRGRSPELRPRRPITSHSNHRGAGPMHPTVLSQLVALEHSANITRTLSGRRRRRR